MSKKSKMINNGMNLRDAKRLARDLGVDVETIDRTGEVRFSYPGLDPVKQNNRRKDATREVIERARPWGMWRGSMAPGESVQVFVAVMEGDTGNGDRLLKQGIERLERVRAAKETPEATLAAAAAPTGEWNRAAPATLREARRRRVPAPARSTIALRGSSQSAATARAPSCTLPPPRRGDRPKTTQVRG